MAGTFCNPCVRTGPQSRMARPGGLELPTFWFVARRSIQLSYGRAVQKYYHSPALRIQPRPEDQIQPLPQQAVLRGLTRMQQAPFRRRFRPRLVALFGQNSCCEPPSQSKAGTQALVSSQLQNQQSPADNRTGD